MGPRETYVLGFPLLGNGEYEIGHSAGESSAASSAIIPPGEAAKLRYKTTFEHFVLSIKPAPILNKLAALVGTTPVEPLNFTRPVNYESPEGAALRRLVLFLADESRTDGPVVPPLVLSELEQTLIVSFLCCTENNFSRMLRGEPRSSAPWQVRRAEEYIAANWDQPITIEALAAATNVSARSLFHSFKKARGYSPMVLVKQIRLNRAREMLSRPRADTSVTGVAFACGFGNLSHFADDYLHRFGERPSETLRLFRT
jgi:AraC-like DNA-binding protein